MDDEIGSQVRDYVDQLLEPASWRIPEDFLTRAHFERVVRDLEWNSSPGYPYCLDFPTNGIFFQVIDGEPGHLALERVWMMVQKRLVDRDADPVRLFVKPEPHTKKKLDSHRYRLISSVSVIDQIIDHMLFGDFNKELIKQHNYTPVKTGWVPYVGGWKQVPVCGMTSCDKSAWDWTVRMWLFEEELGVRERLCKNMQPLWLELATWRYQKLFVENVFVTSGGLHISQKTPGVMKSGCVSTIATNSVMQLLLHSRVAIMLGVILGLIMAMGDDTTQVKQSKEYFELLSQFCILKEVVDKVEFAGCHFYGYRVEPAYKGKHAYNLLHQSEEFHAETADSYALLYHRSAYKNLMSKVLKQLSNNLPSDDWLETIWNGIG